MGCECDMGTEQIVWPRIGDKIPVTIPLTQPVVDPSLCGRMKHWQPGPPHDLRAWSARTGLVV